MCHPEIFHKTIPQRNLYKTSLVLAPTSPTSQHPPRVHLLWLSLYIFVLLGLIGFILCSTGHHLWPRPHACLYSWLCSSNNVIRTLYCLYFSTLISSQLTLPGLKQLQAYFLLTSQRAKREMIFPGFQTEVPKWNLTV